MKFKTRSWSVLVAISLVALIMGGCTLPIPGFNESSPTPIAAPTLVPISTSTSTKSPATATVNLPTPSLTVTKTTAPPLLLQKKLYSGVMVYDRKSTDVQAFGFDGKPLGFKSTLPGADWLGATQVQAFENTVYYFSYKDRQVMRRDLQGLQALTFIPKNDSVHFLISEDQKRIAWSVDSWSANAPGSELWVADINGNNARRIMVKDPKNNPNFLVFHPFRWLQNGQLVFVEEPTGIGGYILFYGFAEIWIIDPATDKFANFSPPVGKGMLCLQQLSPDTVTVISICGGTSPAQLVMYNHLNKTTTRLAVVPDQGQAGSVHYSPNGQWIAYGAARGNADKESGWLVVTPGSGAPINIIHEVKDGYLNVLGWVDNERILFIRYTNDKDTIFIVNKDGSSLVKVADGLFAGMIPVP